MFDYTRRQLPLYLKWTRNKFIKTKICNLYLFKNALGNVMVREALQSWNPVRDRKKHPTLILFNKEGRGFLEVGN